MGEWPTALPSSGVPSMFGSLKVKLAHLCRCTDEPERDHSAVDAVLQQFLGCGVAQDMGSDSLALRRRTGLPGNGQMIGQQVGESVVTESTAQAVRKDRPAEPPPRPDAMACNVVCGPCPRSVDGHRGRVGNPDSAVGSARTLAGRSARRRVAVCGHGVRPACATPGLVATPRSRLGRGNPQGGGCCVWRDTGSTHCARAGCCGSCTATLP